MDFFGARAKGSGRKPEKVEVPVLHAVVVPADLRWSHIGSWGTLWDVRTCAQPARRGK
jgi:hypothetical protein